MVNGKSSLEIDNKTLIGKQVKVQAKEQKPKVISDDNNEQNKKAAAQNVDEENHGNTKDKEKGNKNLNDVPKPKIPAQNAKVRVSAFVAIKPPPHKPVPKLGGKTKKKDETSETDGVITVNEISWISSSSNAASKLSQYAVTGGFDLINGSPMWVIRYKVGNQTLPGRFDINKKKAYVSNNRKVIRIENSNIDILCAPPGRVKWVEAKDGTIPSNAIHAGKSDDGEKLYVGRARKNMSLIPGKVDPVKNVCVICTSEKELAISEFEVLCKINISNNDQVI